MAVRSIAHMQENGQLTLPVEFRERLGLRQGDEVTLTETPTGILIAPSAGGTPATRSPDTFYADLADRPDTREILDRLAK